MDIYQLAAELGFTPIEEYEESLAVGDVSSFLNAEEAEAYASSLPYLQEASDEPKNEGVK